jgi:hypothetical protein
MWPEQSDNETDGGESRVSDYYDSKEDDNFDENESMNEGVDTYLQRVYGTTNDNMENRETSDKQSRTRRPSKRVSRQLRRRSSSVIEALPETTSGWTILVSALLSSLLGYELKLQKSLTQTPLSIGQFPHGSSMESIHAKMTSTADSILSRKIQPSLFVGTRGVMSSTAAYLFGGPSSTEKHLRFREIMTMAQDGAQIALDWEVPWRIQSLSLTISQKDRRAEIMKGPICQPVVIILHGINNDSSFGYMKSLQRSFANRGWNACAMNMRGCGKIKMTTPRGYNASYTGDLRNLVHQISGRLDKDVPVFLVGNSLGANVMTKYLGEEGLSGTLPPCVSGAASLGNPVSINSSLVKFPFNVAMALGVKKMILGQREVFMKFKEPAFQAAYRKALFLTSTIAELDATVAPYLKRNEPFYPYGDRIGFKNGDSYWLDSSSYRLVRYISVPFLNLTAEDDFLVSEPNKNKLGYLVANPNILIVKTRCGGHLGWQESPPESESAFGASSWADVASADFFESVMQVNMERSGSLVNNQVNCDGLGIESPYEDSSELKQLLKEDSISTSKYLQSRL